MKKLVALFLALGLLLTAFAAFAEQPTLKDYIPIDIPYGDSDKIYDLDLKGNDGNWASFWYENGKWNYDNSAAMDGSLYFNTTGQGGIVANKTKLPHAFYVKGTGFELIKDAYYSTYYQNEDNPYVHLFRDEDMDAVFEEIEKWYEITKDGTVSEKNPIEWYSSNTVCVGGLEFRQEKPGLTKKWYNFAAIDLSKQGKQAFELVASNLYVIGTVVVAVDGDSVTVEWRLNKQGTVDANFKNESEFLTFFHDLASVESVEPSSIATSYKFGEPISIEKDLEGDTNVLLYIRNVATYCNNLSYKHQNPIFHPTFDRNDSMHVAIQKAMRALMAADAQ